MKNENVVVKQTIIKPLSLEGEGGQRPGEGVSNKANFISTPSSALRASSPSRGKGAFTLIELLVVVLIIGILAAVAVPQYQKAVEKSKAMQAVALLKSIVPALESYYVSNGSLPNSFDELDIDLPGEWTGNEYFTMVNILDTKSNNEWAIGLDNASSYWKAVQIGHWTGNYKGAGFAYYVTSATPEIPVGQILCAENSIDKTDKVIPFEKDEGDFCEKLLQGTLLINAGNQRFYSFH